MAQKISLTKLAEKTKIQERYLEFLEEEEYHRLPSDIYVRGFLEKYANVLGLDAVPLLEQYKKERSIALKLVGKNLHTTLPGITRKRFMITPKVLGLATLAVVFFGVVIYLTYQWAYLILPPRLDFNNSINNISVSQTPYVLEGVTNSGNSLTINNKKIYIEKDGKFKTEIALVVGENDLKIFVKNQIGRSQAKNIKINYTK